MNPLTNEGTLMLFNKSSASLCLLLATATITFSGTINYQEDSTNFPNPERGYYITSVSANALQAARKEGMTLVRKYYRIDSCWDKDVLPQSVLDGINNDAAILRKEGAKLIPRFAYNFGGANNPPLERMLKHIEQLTPALRSNSDIIAFIEAGFIGMCGEWHFSRSKDTNKVDNTEGRRAVLFKLLDAVPDRMVALRYNFHKRDIFGEAPLGPDSAFNETKAARTGGHNDCFCFDAGDRGSYQGAQSVEWQKTYLSQDNRYVVQGGESCGPASTYSECEKAMADLKRMHWDVINSTFHKGVIDAWKSGGCNDAIEKSLGYRLMITSAQLQDTVKSGSDFIGTIHLINMGWGKIYNHRDCELVFRNTATSKEFIVKLTNDPRRWCMTDSPVAVNVSAPIPASTPEGRYAVYLNLPDPADSIHSRPEYSIRLANQDVWEDSTGYNSLLHKVTISPSP
jgi:hypothetical protein